MLPLHIRIYFDSQISNNNSPNILGFLSIGALGRDISMSVQSNDCWGAKWAYKTIKRNDLKLCFIDITIKKKKKQKEPVKGSTLFYKE